MNCIRLNVGLTPCKYSLHSIPTVSVGIGVYSEQLLNSNVSVGIGIYYKELLNS